MGWQLPSLNPLKAFEAAGRHGSLTRAAKELHVTQGAVSRQVRLLETELGVRLFERRHRLIVLTPEGEQYLADISAAFATIDRSTARLQSHRRRAVLKIQAYTTFAMRWLIPRLPEFNEAHPEIEVQLSASTRDVNFDRDDLDAAIRSGNGQWPGLHALHLCQCALIPVMSPSLAAGPPKLHTAADLARTTLLHSLARPRDWATWLAGTDHGDVDPERGLRFESSSLAYEAARQGLGVAIGQPELIRADLRSGRLVAPIDREVELPEGYYFVWPGERPESPKIQVFRDWLERTAHSAASEG
ncbi:transcriptional regulator GcvA [Streptomyces melanosporofaciens]|uniref:LysR family transcriptional regulator, glycine cleavage system transcriptional activator n=1 Tax=Streptomyces melanosporofaciens TaxID=67327 RepID=A0A1H5CA46_STRMJ|nr:transcriptional regulator GcvA [Streptomyces melanosporofaciens]SED63652.1 LysR family transcriptional regulator, glycine cleavage system transcriptional activator [Streptomyces melanosporofaciens]